MTDLMGHGLRWLESAPRAVALAAAFSVCGVVATILLILAERFDGKRPSFRFEGETADLVREVLEARKNHDGARFRRNIALAAISAGSVALTVIINLSAGTARSTEAAVGLGVIAVFAAGLWFSIGRKPQE